MNYAYFMYTSRCNQTNIYRLNWTDFMSFCECSQAEKWKTVLSILPLHSAVSLNEPTSQLMECRLRKLTG
jgi:hypothetical protein